MIRTGDKVKMSVNFKKTLTKNGSNEHVKEFGDCIGVVEDLVNYNKNGQKDSNKIGPEFNVRWIPSGLIFGYLPENLIKIKEH